MNYVLIGMALMVVIAGCTAEESVEAEPVELEPEPLGTECTTAADCGTAGCSGIVCAPVGQASQIITTCEYRPVYQCYQLSDCGCVAGNCKWEESDAFTACVEGFLNDDPGRNLIQ